MRRAADIMVQSGMPTTATSTVNIDDAWMAGENRRPRRRRSLPRDERGMINANRRFPDMKAMTDYIHGTGAGRRHLNLAGCAHVRRLLRLVAARGADAARFVEWGFDSSSTIGVPTAKHRAPKPDPSSAPAEALSPHGGILKQQPRDIVFNSATVRNGRRFVEVGRRGGRALLADDGDLGLERTSGSPASTRSASRTPSIGTTRGRGLERSGLTSSSGTSAMPTTSKSRRSHRAAHNEQYSYMSCGR